MSYDVKVQYLHFVFDNDEEALAFAKMARRSITREDSSIEVSIVLVDQKEETAEETAENKEEE